VRFKTVKYGLKLQEVPHFHIHIIPKAEKQTGLQFKRPKVMGMSQEEMVKVLETIKAKM